jgi:hypothetical protein
VAQDLIQTASGDDAQRLKRSMRAFKSALAWGMGVLDHIGRHCKWPPTVKSEVANRVSEMTKAPLEFAVKEGCRWRQPRGKQSAAPMLHGPRCWWR